MTPKVITIRNLNGKEDEIMKTMKMFVAALVCFASVACVKENMDPQVSSQPEKGAFVGVRSDFGGTKTKTVLTENYKVLWDSDDAIAVWDGTEIYRIENNKGRVPSQTLREAGWNVGYRYSVTTKVNSASTGFKYSFYQDGTNHIKDNYTQGTADADGVLVEGFNDISEGYELASGEGTWYLMNSNFSANFIANCETKQFRAWLDDDQKIPVGTFVDSRDFAVAKTQDLSKPVVFKNAISLLEFVVPEQMDGKITKITVTPNATGEYLAGDLLIDYSGDAPVTSLWALSENHNALESEKSKYTSLKLVPASGSVFAAGKYYAVACPGTLTEGLTVTATLTTGMTLTRSSEKKCTFKESYVYGMGEIDAASENYNGGIREFPYMFSVYTEYGPKGANTGADNSYKYVTAVSGTYDSSTYQLENIYTDSEYSSVKLNVKMAGTSSGQVRTTPVWANQWGYDNIPAKSFVSPEFLTALGEDSPYKDVETYFLLKAPLATTLGNRFNVSVGMHVNADGLRNWKIEYSNDGETWYGSDQGTFAIVNTTASYRYYTVTFDSTINFTVGDILYVKLSPVGTIGVNGNDAVCWNKEVRLTSGILVYPLSEGSTPVPSEAIYFESFDKLTEGADYLLGERLGAMDNLHGPLCSDWSDEQINGLTLKKVAMRPGYAQIGYVTNGSTGNTNASNKGSLTTPILAAGQLKLSFKAMAFHTNKDRLGNYSASDCTESSTINDVKNPDATSIVVTINEGSFSQTESLKTYTIDNVSTSEWETKNLVIYGATADTQITFSSPEDATYARWFLDDICVTKAQ